MAASQVVKSASCGLQSFEEVFLARFCAWFVAFQLAPKFATACGDLGDWLRW